MELLLQMYRRHRRKAVTAASATRVSADSLQHDSAFQPFQLEEWQSRWEYEVECNLADSGVQPVKLGELVDSPEALQVYSLGYGFDARSCGTG